MLNKFSEMIRGNLPKMLRAKVVALVTIEVHARDVIEKLIKASVNDVTAFEWLMQLRVYWDKEIDDCVVRQTNTQFQYGYEYLGNSGRLVITPLTDRYVAYPWRGLVIWGISLQSSFGFSIPLFGGYLLFIKVLWQMIH